MGSLGTWAMPQSPSAPLGWGQEAEAVGVWGHLELPAAAAAARVMWGGMAGWVHRICKLMLFGQP